MISAQKRVREITDRDIERVVDVLAQFLSLEGKDIKDFIKYMSEDVNPISIKDMVLRVSPANFIVGSFNWGGNTGSVSDWIQCEINWKSSKHLAQCIRILEPQECVLFQDGGTNLGQSNIIRYTGE